MYQHWQSAAVYTKEYIGQSFEKCAISKAMDSIEDDLFQMDSFDCSDKNFEDYSPRRV